MQKRLLLIMAMFAVSASLIACGVQETKVQESSAASTEEITQVSEVETTDTATDTATADTEPLEKATTEAEKTDTEASVAEPTTELTPEQIVYEGIDMESTLPGIEWMNSFEGIIDEPKLVVFNDETNKKVIVGDGETVEFTREDLLSIYTPNNLSVVLMEGGNINGTMYYSPVCTQVMIGELEGENLIGVTFLDVNGEMMSISCTIVAR